MPTLGLIAVTPDLRERITETIACYDLHAILPVPIRQLARDLGCDVRFRERMAPLYGWATLEDGRPVIGINASISVLYQRYTLGHELGHYLAGHLSADAEHSVAGVITGRDADERTADAIAALLLVPPYALADYATDREAARACEVPVKLIRLRRRLDTS